MSIPCPELVDPTLASHDAFKLRQRVSDGAMLHLTKMWLKAPVEEDGGRGKPTRRGTGNRGTPQGGVPSPMLANVSMRRFLKAWER